MYKIIQGEKGREAVATKNISVGKIILKETPGIICEDLYDCIYKIFIDSENGIENDSECNSDLADKYENMVPYTIDEQLITQTQLEQEIERLPMYMQDFFNNMINNGVGNKGSVKLRLLAAKFYRNAFTYDTKYGGPSAVLFKGSQFNHSCDPNINFYIDKNGDFIFQAKKDIRESEELYIKYIDTNLSYKKRQNLLFTQYGFQCKCVKCTSTRV